LVAAAKAIWFFKTSFRFGKEWLLGKTMYLPIKTDEGRLKIQTTFVYP